MKNIMNKVIISEEKGNMIVYGMYVISILLLIVGLVYSVKENNVFFVAFITLAIHSMVMNMLNITVQRPDLVISINMALFLGSILISIIFWQMNLKPYLGASILILLNSVAYVFEGYKRSIELKKTKDNINLI